MDAFPSLTRWLIAPTRIASRRRWLAAGLAGLAVICGLHAVRPRAVPSAAVWVAARDLPGGSALVADDVRVVRLPVADVPSGALPGSRAVVGRLLAAPMRRGEPFTDVRLLGAKLLAAAAVPGSLAVPVRVADAAAAMALVHAGDLVDVIAVTDPEAVTAASDTVVVHDVRVLATPSHATPDGVDDGAGLVIIAASPRQAARLAQVAATSRLSVSVRSPA